MCEARYPPFVCSSERVVSCRYLLGTWALRIAPKIFRKLPKLEAIHKLLERDREGRTAPNSTSCGPLRETHVKPDHIFGVPPFGDKPSLPPSSRFNLVKFNGVEGKDGWGGLGHGRHPAIVGGYIL